MTSPAEPLRVALTSDHNGGPLRALALEWLAAHGYAVEDRTPVAAAGAVVDYPALCEDVCRRVLAGDARFGLVIGGSGQGEQIACNKIRGIRAALCNEPFATEIARAHNDANVMVVGARVVAPGGLDELLTRWFGAVFKGGVHQRRVEQILALERGETLL